MSSDFFRANVGACIVCNGSLVLFRRISSQATIWQMPQGGLLLSEDPEEGIYRELFEEVGLTPGHLVLIDKLPFWLGYELPSRLRRKPEYGRGQVQKWFLFSIKPEDLMHISFLSTDAPEFDDYRMVSLKEVDSYMPDFKVSVICEMLGWFHRYHPSLFFENVPEI